VLRTKDRLGIIAGLAIAVVVLSVIAILGPNQWLAGIAPILGSLLLLLVIYHGYFIARSHRWRHRQREEKQALQKLAIRATIRRPESFKGVESIHQVQGRLLERVPDYQGRYRAAGLTIAFLPPLALLFLSLQIVFFPHGGSWGAGFVFAEALLLGCLIFLVWQTRNPSLTWVQSRLRGELLRREQYLCLAAVGPYLSKDAGHDAPARLERIEKGDILQLWRLVPLATPDLAGKGDWRWLDDIWRQTGDAVRLTEPAERMQCYLYYRLEKQIMWFRLGTHLNDRIERWITRTLKAAVLVALAAALTHGVLLALEVHPGSGQESPASMGTLLLAFVLPPFGAALLASQNLFAFRTFSWSYNETRKELLRFKANLQRLLGSFSSSLDEHERIRLGVEFQALVLHAEAELSHEMERWLMLVHRPEFEVAP
jgi:hypothetical protein